MPTQTAGSALAIEELRTYAPTCRRGAGFADNLTIDSGRIRGRAVPYGVTVELAPDLYEVFSPGTFHRQTKDPRRVKVCLDHGQVVGRCESLEEKDDGLYFDGMISASPDISEARRARALLDEDLVDELSVGFNTVRDGSVMEKRNDGSHMWTHHRARLLEISLTPWGVYGRDATLARAVLVDSAASLRAARQAAYRAWFTDWRK